MAGIDPVPKFSVGQTAITARAAAILGMIDLRLAMARHVSGDWGIMDADDRRANYEALANGGRLVSINRTADGVKFYIITEAERDRTRILLPEEY